MRFGEGNRSPLQYSCLENSMGRGAWQAIVHGVTESDTAEHVHTYEVNTLIYILLLCNNIITSKCYFLSFYNPFLIVACMRYMHRIYHHVCMVCMYIYTQWWLLLSFRANNPKSRTHTKSKQTKPKISQFVFHMKFLSLCNLAIFWNEFRCFIPLPFWMHNLHPF